jgi:hypothetical protein
LSALRRSIWAACQAEALLVQIRQDRIAKVVRDALAKRGQVPQEARLFRLVPVEDAEIDVVILVGLEVHVAAQLAQQVGLPAFHREMGDLGVAVAQRRGGGAPHAFEELARHLHARSVDPAQEAELRATLGVAAGALHGGPVDAEAEIGEGAEQGLHAPALAEIVGRATGVAFDRQPRVPVDQPVRAHGAPRHHDAFGAFGHGGDEVRKASFARLDVQEFVAVEDHEPVGVDHVRIGLGGAKGGRLGLFVRPRRVVAADDGRADQGQPVEHRVGPVAAVVGIDDDAVEADQLLKGDPFEKRGRLVAHHGQRCQPLGHGKQSCRRGLRSARGGG